MSPERQTYFRGKLLGLQADIEGDLNASQSASNVVELDTAIGRLSRMDAMQDQQMALELRRRQEQQLQRITNALKRISNGIVTLGLADDDGDSAAPSGAQRVRQMSKTDDAFGIQLPTGALIDEYKVAPSNPLPTFLVFEGVATRNRNIPI